MQQQLLEKVQSKCLLSTGKKVFVQRIAVEPTASLGIHLLFHKFCSFKVCLLSELHMFSDVMLLIEVLIKQLRYQGMQCSLKTAVKIKSQYLCVFCIRLPPNTILTALFSLQQKQVLCYLPLSLHEWPIAPRSHVQFVKM